MLGAHQASRLRLRLDRRQRAEREGARSGESQAGDEHPDQSRDVPAVHRSSLPTPELAACRVECPTIWTTRVAAICGEVCRRADTLSADGVQCGCPKVGVKGRPQRSERVVESGTRRSDRDAQALGNAVDRQIEEEAQDDDRAVIAGEPS